MKTKLLFAGLVASAALVGCTNDELIETTGGSANAPKGETTLVFDGFGGAADTKMAYDEGDFKWQKDDEIGVRRVQGDIVISNTMFKVVGTSDQNTGDPSQWTGTQGAYAFFESNDETLHEADYIVTFPYDKSSVQDGKVIGRLPVAQVANANDGTIYSNNEYAGNYGFMMSTATHMTGGQNTEHFILYPVFSRIEFNITQSTTLGDVKVQSIILESQDGSAIFPTTLEVGADVTVAADGQHLDTKYMTPGQDKVSEIVLTTKEKALNATTPQTWYMTLVPGTYEKYQVRINTNKGYFVKTYDAHTFNTGNKTTCTIDINDLDPYTEYVVASQVDWEQALGNIAQYLSNPQSNPSIGNTSTIRVMGNVTVAADKFRAADIKEITHTINVVGDGKITIDGDLDNASVTTLGIMNFNVPVIVKGDFKEVAKGDQLTFAELNVVGGSDNIGDLVLDNAPNFKSIVVESGVVTGATTYRMTGTDAALTMENVAFGGKVTVSAMTANGNDATKKTTKVNFNNCSFTGGLDVADSWQGTTAVTVSGGAIANEAGNATLTVGIDNASTKTSVLYVKGDVTADIVDVQKVYSGKSTLDILGSLTANTEVKNNDASDLLIQQEATLTIGEDATFKANATAKIEGTLVNNGILTVPSGVTLTDVEPKNNHEGMIENNGILWAPATEWYDNQHVDVTFKGNYEYVLSDVTSADIEDAIENVEDEYADKITGVELTNTSAYNFEEDADYSAYDIYVTAATTLDAPGCKFGNLTVRANAVTLNNGKASTTEFGNVAIESGKLSIDNTVNAATTLKCADVELSQGATLEHARQLDCANANWSNGDTGTIIWD